MVKEDQVTYEHFCFGCDMNEDCPAANGSLDDVLLTLSLMEDAFIEIIAITNVLSDVIACERVNSIYVDLIYVATCTDMPYALTWMFAMLLIFSSLGLTILTFRAAILPPKKALDYHDNTTNERVEEITPEITQETIPEITKGTTPETTPDTYKIDFGNEVTALNVRKVE